MRRFAFALLAWLCTCTPQGKCEFDRDKNLVDYCNPSLENKNVATCEAVLVDRHTWTTGKPIPFA